MEIEPDTLRDLPKADLHCHLDGSVRPESIASFMKEDGQAVPDNLETQLRVGQDSRSLADYLQAFDLPVDLLQTPERLEQVARELVQDAARENVWYLEIRFAPYLHVKEGLSAREVLKAVLKGLESARDQHNIKTGIILSGLRHADPSRTLDLAKLAVEFKGMGVVGFDLAGAERDNPAKEHLEAFYVARNHNLNVTIHAGEDFGPESIKQAIHYCGAHRIGHGVRLREDPELLEFVRDHRIPLEMCLTSNVQTQAVESFTSHPLQKYLEQGLRVTINTDNRTVSNTTLTEEYSRAVDTFQLSLKDIRKLVINGFKSSFLPFDEKRDLLLDAIDTTEDILYDKNLDLLEWE